MDAKRFLACVVSGGFLLLSYSAVSIAAEEKEGKKDDDCIGCHVSVTPGIVKQHLDSPMANTKHSKDYVGCTDCHGDLHQDMDDYASAEFPTPATCGKCHKEQVEQYRKGKHDKAWFGMKTQAAWHNQPSSIVKQGYRGCSGCHKMGRKGYQGIMDGNKDAVLKHDGGKEASEYRYGNAQCDACHTRHSFKKSEASDPRACSNCHMGFDHPQWEMYTSSKHGIIWAIEEGEGGTRAPTCQTCHMSEGNHEVRTAWGFLGLRIPTKENVLALIKVAPAQKANLTKLAAQLPSGHYDGVDDTPQWTYDRALILQAAGILDNDFQPTERFVESVLQAQTARGPEEFNKERAKMKKACNECHSIGYVDDHMNASDDIIRQADHVYAKAIAAVQALYKDGILKKPAGWKYAPDLLQYYDAKTHIEQELYLIMLEHRQRAFQGAFHASNDYMHWYGWAPLNTAVNTIMEEAGKLRAEHKNKAAKK